MPKSEGDYTEKVRELNDLLRTTFIGGRVLLTEGIRALSEKDQEEILTKVRTFEKFRPGDDPYGEHDFGAIDHEGQKVYFKIDYYDPSLQWHSEDASDPRKTRRVLTILLAEEY